MKQDSKIHNSKFNNGFGRYGCCKFRFAISAVETFFVCRTQEVRALVKIAALCGIFAISGNQLRRELNACRYRLSLHP